MTNTNTVIRGQYLALQQFKDHEAEERRRNIAITRLKNEQFDPANHDTHHASNCDDYLGQRNQSEAVMEESVDSVSSLADGLQVILFRLQMPKAFEKPPSAPPSVPNPLGMEATVSSGSSPHTRIDFESDSALPFLSSTIASAPPAATNLPRPITLLNSSNLTALESVRDEDEDEGRA